MPSVTQRVQHATSPITTYRQHCHGFISPLSTPQKQQMENQSKTIRHPTWLCPWSDQFAFTRPRQDHFAPRCLRWGWGVSEALEACADTVDLDLDTYRKVMMLQASSDFGMDGATSLACGTDLMGPNADTLAEWAMWKLTEYPTSRTIVL